MLKKKNLFSINYIQKILFDVKKLKINLGRQILKKVTIWWWKKFSEYFLVKKKAKNTLWTTKLENYFLLTKNQKIFFLKITKKNWF